jgi:hypothetical protein
MSVNLDQLQDWFNTQIEIMVNDTGGKTYSGNILELLLTLGMMNNWICEFIKYIKIQKSDMTSNEVKELIDKTVLPYNKVYNVDDNGKFQERIIDTYEESKIHGMYVATLTSEELSTKQNLLNLCNAILILDADKLQALNDVVCGNNWLKWSELSKLNDQNRATQGYKRTYQRTHDSVSPWVKMGGRRTRHKRSGHKKRSGKRSGHKRSGKRSGHKRSGKRSSKSRRH